MAGVRLVTSRRHGSAVRTLLIGVFLPIVLAVVACGSTVHSIRHTESPLVDVSGDGLQLDGRPWWPTGLNAYQLATDWDVNVGCGAEVDLDAFFGELPDGSLTRFNAFQSLAVNRYSGELDFTAIDRVVEAAERYGQMVLPVLAGQDGACEDEVFKQRDWYLEGWRERAEMPLSHHDWVVAAVNRWSASQAIAAWEPVGEPEPSVCPTGNCDLPVRSCPTDSAEVLRAWTDEVGQLIREQDPGRLITSGVIGGDQCGIAGDGYAQLADSPFVDVMQYHDYDNAALLPARLEQVDVPILVAEIGVPAGSCESLDERAEKLSRRLDDHRALGAAGAMLWAFVPDPRTADCTMDIGPDDPVLDRPEMQPGRP